MSTSGLELADKLTLSGVAGRLFSCPNFLNCQKSGFGGILGTDKQPIGPKLNSALILGIGWIVRGVGGLDDKYIDLMIPVIRPML